MTTNDKQKFDFIIHVSLFKRKNVCCTSIEFPLKALMRHPFPYCCIKCQ